jgi:hypothetical protein
MVSKTVSKRDLNKSRGNAVGILGQYGRRRFEIDRMGLDSQPRNRGMARKGMARFEMDRVGVDGGIRIDSIRSKQAVKRI